MQRVSSNLTLALVIFLPILWITFFGAFTLAIWVYKMDYYGTLPGATLRLGMLGFWLAGLLVFVFTIWRLKRVEIDHEYLYVTNYFKHVRYPLVQIAHFEVKDWRLFKIISIRLQAKGSFGQHIIFLPSGSAFETFAGSHEELSLKRRESGRGRNAKG
jgi:nitrate reductase NapE component